MVAALGSNIFILLKGLWLRCDARERKDKKEARETRKKDEYSRGVFLFLFLFLLLSFACYGFRERERKQLFVRECGWVKERREKKQSSEGEVGMGKNQTRYMSICCDHDFFLV